MLVNLLVFCTKFIQNTTKSISILYEIYRILIDLLYSILYEFHTEYLFESNLYWVYSNIHVTQIAVLDWLTSS